MTNKATNVSAALNHNFQMTSCRFHLTDLQVCSNQVKTSSQIFTSQTNGQDLEQIVARYQDCLWGKYEPVHDQISMMLDIFKEPVGRSWWIRELQPMRAQKIWIRRHDRGKTWWRNNNLLKKLSRTGWKAVENAHASLMPPLTHLRGEWEKTGSALQQPGKKNSYLYHINIKD